MTKTKQATIFDKYTVTLADLTGIGAATSGTITLDTLPANSIVTMTFVKPTTALAGGSVSAATARVSSNSKVFGTAFDVFQTVGATVVDFDDEAQFIKSTASDLILTVTLTGGNASTLTAGQIDVYVESVTLS